MDITHTTSTEAIDYAEGVALARRRQESSLANIRRAVTSESPISEAARDLDIRFWAEGLIFWTRSEKNWNERLKALGEQS